MLDETKPATEYLTAADVRRVVGVTPAAVRALAARGKLIPAAVTVGGVHLYTHQTAERYAAEGAARQRGGGGGAADGDSERS